MDRNTRGWLIVGIVAVVLIIFIFASIISHFSELKELLAQSEAQAEQLRADLSAKNQEVAQKDEAIKNLEGQVSELTSKRKELEQKQARGEIEQVWFEHNQYRDYRKGMVIHVKFSLYNTQSMYCELDAYFYSSDNKPLKDFDGDFKTVTGEVSVGERFITESEVAKYSDFQLFMPYDELHLNPGTHQLKFNVQVSKRLENSIFDTSEYYNFTITQS